MRLAYLGPPGTNSHDALIAAGAVGEPLALATVGAVVAAVQEGRAGRGLVPVENSREGAVAATLDALVFDAPDVVVVGELVHPVSYCLAARGRGGASVGDAVGAMGAVRTVHSHPQATAQCARFLAERLPDAAVVPAASTADAVRAVAAGDALPGEAPHAAIGSLQAAALYGGAVLAEGIEDDPGNATRFAWLARRDAAPPPDALVTDAGDGMRADAARTALVFWGAGDLTPGWLVACLAEFATRGISLTRIESRPRRIGLGHYMFFCDLAGGLEREDVRAAVAGLRGRCEGVRVLGSYPAADRPAGRETARDTV